MVRSAAALAGHCLVGTSLSPPTLQAPSPPCGGEPPPGPTRTGSTSVWWGESNLKVLFGLARIAVFSTPEVQGSLGTDGPTAGGALYFWTSSGSSSVGVTGLWLGGPLQELCWCLSPPLWLGH